MASKVALGRSNQVEWIRWIQGLKPCVAGTVPLQKIRHQLLTLLRHAGNGRSEFNPPAKGNQWTVGAVGCPRWTGVRLRDVLRKYKRLND